MRRLLLVPLAFLLLHCSGSAVRPQPGGSNAGTSAGSGSNGGSGTTSATTSGGTTSGGTTSGGTTSATTSGGTTSGGTTSGGSTGSSSSGSSGATTSSGSGSTTSSSSGATTSGGTTTGGTTTGGTTTGGTTTGSTTTTGGTTTGSTGAANAYIRVADFVYDQPVAVDFCVKPSSSSTWAGPELAAVGGQLDYGKVTLYFGFADPSGGAGTSYDVAVVASGANNTACGLSTNQTTLTAVANTYQTIVGSGSYLTPTFTVLTDDTTVGSAETKYRFMNASPDNSITTVDFGTVTAGSVIALLKNVTYPNLGTTLAGPGTLNANDYVVTAAQPQAKYGVRNHAPGNGSPLSNTLNTTLGGGQLHSFFFSGTGGAGFQLNACQDVLDAPSNANRGLSVCQ